MNRRSLFKRIGAAAAVVAVAPPVKAVDVTPDIVNPERAQAEAIFNRWLESEDGQQEIVRQATILRGERAVDEAYHLGLTIGLDGAIDRYFSVEELATVTVASADGRYVARVTDPRVRSV